MTSGVALLAGLALVLGSALILALSVYLAAAIAAKINPEPAVPVAADLERAEAEFAERERHLEAREAAEEARGRESIDSSHLTFPTFAIVFGLFMLFGAWSAVLDHADAGGGPVPLSVLLRPLWLPWVPAMLAALIAPPDTGAPGSGGRSGGRTRRSSGGGPSGCAATAAASTPSG